MARSAVQDPVEKYRFRITVISIDLSLTGLIDAVGAVGDNTLGVITRAGFSKVTLPRVNIKTMKYRENIDSPRFLKMPGLVTYDKVTLSRGVTGSKDLYDWYRVVNEEMALLAVAQELGRDARFSPKQSSRFRKDVIIEVLGRDEGVGVTPGLFGEDQGSSEAQVVKGWFLFNAFPASYTPGNELDALTEEKLIEELTLDYEMFIEFEGGLEGFAKELAKGAALGAAGAVAGFLSNRFGLSLPGSGSSGSLEL